MRPEKFRSGGNKQRKYFNANLLRYENCRLSMAGLAAGFAGVRLQREDAPEVDEALAAGAMRRGWLTPAAFVGRIVSA